jgi:hypothetical protein
MEPPSSSPNVRFVSEPRHVREVSLVGSADLAFWQARLATEGLVPDEQEGRARLLIVAGAMC